VDAQHHTISKKLVMPIHIKSSQKKTLGELENHKRKKSASLQNVLFPAFEPLPAVSRMKTMRNLSFIRGTKHTHIPQFQQQCDNDRESNAMRMSFRNRIAYYFSHGLKQLSLSIPARKFPNNKRSKHTENVPFVVQTAEMYYMKSDAELLSELMILFSDTKFDGNVVEVQSESPLPTLEQMIDLSDDLSL